MIKWGSAVIFIGFGAVGLYENLPKPMLTPVVIILGFLTIIGLTFLIARWNNKKPGLTSIQEGKSAIDQNGKN